MKPVVEGQLECDNEWIGRVSTICTMLKASVEINKANNGKLDTHKLMVVLINILCKWNTGFKLHLEERECMLYTENYSNKSNRRKKVMERDSTEYLTFNSFQMKNKQRKKVMDRHKTDYSKLNFLQMKTKMQKKKVMDRHRTIQ